MKRSIVSLLTCLVLASVALAHSPSDIKVSYHKTDQFLTIQVRHQVGDPQSHYVNKVEVKMNGKLVLSQLFDRQYNDQQQLVMVLVPGLKAGTELEVKADCSRFGSKTSKLKI